MESTALQTIEICSVEGCETMDVLDNGFALTTIQESPGIFTKTYTASLNNEKVEFFVTSRSVEATSLSHSIDHVPSLVPEDTLQVDIEFDYTGAQPRNMDIKLEAHNAVATQHVEELDPQTKVSFLLPGMVLRPEENELRFTITYTDELGTYREETLSSSILLTDVTFVQQVNFFLEDVGYWLANVLGP